MENSKRTVTCGELTKADVGRKVVLNGWVSRTRDLGGLVFIRLRDRYGITQVMVGDKASEEVKKIASSLKSETNQKAGYYYNQILSLLPHLVYSEELDLLSKLAKKVEIQTEKVKIENHAKNISEKDAEILFEHFSGMGQGLDFETEKNSYLSKKHLTNSTAKSSKGKK